ncbi:unnamed protein product, partial [Mesorhabditis spiculigera]
MAHGTLYKGLLGLSVAVNALFCLLFTSILVWNYVQKQHLPTSVAISFISFIVLFILFLVAFLLYMTRKTDASILWAVVLTIARFLVVLIGSFSLMSTDTFAQYDRDIEHDVVKWIEYRKMLVIGFCVLYLPLFLIELFVLNKYHAAQRSGYERPNEPHVYETAKFTKTIFGASPKATMAAKDAKGQPQPGAKAGEPPFQMKIDPEKYLNIKWKPEAVNVEVKIENITKVRQTFKVKCTDNNIFRVRPPLGFIKPGESTKIKITCTSPKLPENNRHLFAIYHFKSEETKLTARQVWTPDVKPDGVTRIVVLFDDKKEDKKEEEKKENPAVSPDKKEEKKDEKKDEKKEEKKDEKKDDKKEEKKDEKKDEEKDAQDDKKDEKKEEEKKEEKKEEEKKDDKKDEKKK